MKEVSYRQVYHVVIKMKRSKSKGENELCSLFLKKTSPEELRVDPQN